MNLPDGLIAGPETTPDEFYLNPGKCENYRDDLELAGFAAISKKRKVIVYTGIFKRKNVVHRKRWWAALAVPTRTNQYRVLITGDRKITAVYSQKRTQIRAKSTAKSFSKYIASSQHKATGPMVFIAQIQKVAQAHGFITKYGKK